MKMTQIAVAAVDGNEHASLYALGEDGTVYMYIDGSGGDRDFWMPLSNDTEADRMQQWEEKRNSQESEKGTDPHTPRTSAGEQESDPVNG